MVGNIITSYPVFESGQLLTSSQLNDTRSYLDENLRVNRTILNGVGVVSGLEISYNPAGDGSITISKGIGITTDGYLVSLPTDVVYTKYDAYTEYPGDPLMPVYPAWYNPSTSEAFQIQQLAISTGAGGALSGLPDLASQVVLLFLKEIIDEQSTFCVSTDSDSSGSVKRYDLLVLMMKEADFDLLTAYNNEALTARNAPVSVLRMKRFATVANSLSTPLTSFANPTPIQTVYSTIVEEYKVSVGTRIKNAFASYSAYLGLNFNESSQTFDQFIDANLNTNATLASGNINYIQYVYSYLKDLIDAVDEFSEAAYQSFKDTQPVNGFTYVDPKFPRHLALGRVTPKASMPGLVYKQKYRYYFTELFPLENKEEEILKAQLLFEKIILMVKTFSIPGPGAGVPVLITPSRKEEEVLSARAIPFYYDMNVSGIGTRLYTIWNTDAYLRNLSTSQVQSGTVQIANTSGTNPSISGLAAHVSTPLDYSLNPSDFYRIEGHIGRTITDAQTQLNTLRKTKNLDFNVVSLELTTATPVNPLVENHDMSLFHHFVDVNFGIEHKGGVEAGGTFVLVHFGTTVVADFSLPSQTPYSALLY